MPVITQRVSGVLVALFMVGATVETSQADEDDQMSKDIEAWMLSMGASTVLHWKSVADRTSLLVSLAEPTKVIVCSQSRAPGPEEVITFTIGEVTTGGNTNYDSSTGSCFYLVTTHASVRPENKSANQGYMAIFD